MRLAAPPPRRETGERYRRGVFLDQGGLLVGDVPQPVDRHPVDPASLRFTPNAIEGLRRLDAAGYLLMVLSHQPDVARRRVELSALKAFGDVLGAMLADEGVRLAGVYVCPHAPPGERFGGGCRCREPAPGLLLEAARDHGIDLGRSWMLGDTLDGVEAGWRAGCGTVLMDVGHETEWRWSPIRIPDFRVPDLSAAADAMIAAPAVSRSRVLLRHPTIRRPQSVASRSLAARS